MAENVTGDWSTKFNKEKYAKNYSELKDQSLLLSNQKISNLMSQLSK